MLNESAYERVRRAYHVEKKSVNWIAQEEGYSCQTITKIESRDLQYRRRTQRMSDISTIKESVATGTVEGHCNARFDEVRQEFVRNFQERDEVGASVSIILNGETAVDLWGGSADPTNG